jgi:hypothetical protein
MQIGFVMPNESERLRIGTLQQTIDRLREDQRSHMEHLLCSWKIFHRVDGIDLAYRALKRTLRDMP